MLRRQMVSRASFADGISNYSKTNSKEMKEFLGIGESGFVFHTFGGVRVKRVVVSVTPHVNGNEIADVRRDFAFHDCRVASNYVLVVSFHLVVLNDGLIYKKNFNFTIVAQLKNNWEGSTGFYKKTSNAIPAAICSPSSSIHSTTCTKSATKEGIKHLIIAEFPRITYSAGVISAL